MTHPHGMLSYTIKRWKKRQEAMKQPTTDPQPVAWRCRWDDERDWKYGEKPLAERDRARKMPGFDEQALYARGSSVKDGGVAA